MAAGGVWGRLTLSECSPHPIEHVRVLGAGCWVCVWGGAEAVLSKGQGGKEPSAAPAAPGAGLGGSGYSQHSEGPQPVEGVDGDAAQPVVAQDPAEKDTVPCWPFLSRLLTGALSTLWTSQSKRFTFPTLPC